MQEDLSKERALLYKIYQYMECRRKGNIRRLQSLEHSLIEDLKSYFKKDYIHPIMDLPDYKEILESKLRANNIFEIDMLSNFNTWFDGIILDEYFDKSWEALWKYANEKGIYEQKKSQKDCFVLGILRNLILDIMKKIKKKQSITSEDQKYIVNYYACFKSIDMKNIDIALAYFESFDTYYFETLYKDPNELTMLEKIHYGKRLADERKEQEKNMKISRKI